MLTVEDVMTPKPITLSRYNSMADARKLMNEHGFRHLPVVDEQQQVIGLVSQRNILANSISSQSYIDAKELAKIEVGTLVADFMTTEITTITQNTCITDAALLIHKKKFGCLPVVNNQNELIGIITDHDFVAISVQLLDMMTQSEPPEPE
ncbi:CBS domain-containing protein [Aliikangiella sp. IMCC44359]|uniref:CBS domain-containing protein n=1 Tax=Aliikangiella sp. IMCC44359 TaxID=3459125 RepID=UPI00403B31E0